MDIDLQALPAQPGKAIQLELKTIMPAGPGRHMVNVDLGQLWEYSHKPLAAAAGQVVFINSRGLFSAGR